MLIRPLSEYIEKVNSGFGTVTVEIKMRIQSISKPERVMTNG